MPRNTSSQDSESTLTRITQTFLGVIILTTGAGVSFAAVLIGESGAYNQMQNSFIGQNLWFAASVLALAATIVGAVVMLFIILELFTAIGQPNLSGRTEYTILGLGGLIGTGLATLASVTLLFTNADILNQSLPTGSGESALALAAVAIPFSAIFYTLYTPSKTPVPSNTTNDGNEMEPEVIKQKTEPWSEEAAINPAYPPGKGPDSTATPSNNDNQSPPPAHNSESQETGRDPGNNRNTGRDLSDMEFNWQTETDVSFDDIGGMDDLKTKLRNEAIKPLENPEKAEKLGVAAPNIIFHGPPGTGKTYTAEALATELGLPFASLSGADIQSKWINESSSMVNNLFSEAREMAAREGGAVVFLDELDSVLKNRSGSGSSHEEDNKVVNEFLNHLEDTKDHGIVFIGATNRLEALDDAGIRSGRIDLKIKVGKPDVEAREEILRAQLDDREHNIPETGIEELAAATDGAVAADLELLINRAAKNVLTRGGDVIQWSDVEVAVANDN